MKRILGVCILIALFLLALAVLRPSPTRGDTGIDAGTNALRAQTGLHALATSSALTALASERAEEISTDFNHHSLNGRVPACTSAWGENIAYSGYSNPDFVQMWANSPEHRANMLGDWQYQGSATYTVGSVTYAVQIFIRGCAVVSTPPPSQHSEAPVLLPNTSVTCPTALPSNRMSYLSSLVKTADSM